MGVAKCWVEQTDGRPPTHSTHSVLTAFNLAFSDFASGGVCEIDVQCTD